MNSNEKLESTKMSLYNAEQLANIKANPVVKTTILAVIKSVPVLGRLIDSTIDAILTKFQQKKRDSLLDIILADSNEITSDMVNNVEFIINFGKTLEAVNHLATNDKVKYFANLLKNGYFTNDPIKNDEFEEYLNLLNELSYREIFILIEFSKSFNKVYKSQHVGGYLDKPEFLAYKEKMTTIFSISEGELADILSKLQNKGLCMFQSGHGFTKNDGEYARLTTDLFEKFKKRIVDETND